MAELTYRAFVTADDLGTEAAQLIVRGILGAAEAGRPYLLGCPGGRTAKPIYDALGEACAGAQVNCRHVVIVMMDDYVELMAGEFVPVDAAAAHSCRRFAEFDIRRVINAGLSSVASIPAESIWFPDPEAPEGFDHRLEAAGGVDLFIVASGASDGHVAFCGPGSDIEAGASVVELALTTRHDNMSTFPSLRSLDDVPTHGVTVGLGTIRRVSRSVLMVLHGADKRESLCRIRAADVADPLWPATFVHACESAMVWFDAQAASPDRSP